ncbi:MAG: Aminotransferase, class V [Candidatus Uhrbacteria bacterium GW2011_GWA2_52_8d]|uniref:Aminotransferase, class V n=1 Tax=Candidatus Uhrbacteria bacterium GW2011_GWA2_52_8d TaxID=1618979 RepID=A0A0G1XQG3_9BACT|nr:MAG: Aminotransferase, class V [Candidatus Uhrbacteria bacterium GW2011_GWA2_52_8d]
MQTQQTHEVVYQGENWIMVQTQDDNLFDVLYKEGYERVVLMNQLPDGTFEYIIGKKTEKTEDFPVGPETEKGSFLFELNKMEPGWAGSVQYGGAPMNTDGSRSLLTPQMIIDIINKIVNKRDEQTISFKINTTTEINPEELFSKDVLHYQVETKQLGKVDYVNLDNAATTPPLITVQQGVDEYLKTYGSVHRGAGTKSKISTDVYEQTRQTIKEFVGAPENFYVLFSGNTTGAMNTAAYFFSFLDGKVAVSEIEHSSSWLPWVKTEGEKSLGANRVDFAHVPETQEKIQEAGREMVLRYPLNSEGEFDLAGIEEMLKTNKIKAFVLTASSNLTGYRPDIRKIGELVHKYGAYYIVDACQFLQHHKIDMMEMGIDFLAASGHKFYAPYGGGFLIGPKNFLDEFLPYQIGGGNLPYITKEGVFLRYKNQLAHDPGTPNAVGAVSMAIAFNQLKAMGIEKIEAYETGLARRAYEAMKKNKKVRLLVRDNHLSTVIPFVIIDQDSRAVAERLNKEFGIGVRAGSFCVYDVVRNLLEIKDESKIIEAVNHGDTSLIPGIIRASFALCNTNADVDRLIQAINFITKTNL